MDARTEAVTGSEVGIVRNLGPLAALEAAWNDINDPTHPGAPFRSFPWIATWWNSFSVPGEPAVLVARERRVIVGLLPIYLEPLPLGGKRVRMMGDRLVGSDYLGVVSRAADAARLAARFTEGLQALRAQELFLDDLSEDEPLALSIAAARIHLRYPCPYVRIEGDFESYLRERPGGVGPQWHRRRRWLEKRPGHRFELLSAPDEVARGMEVLFDLHRRRWALEGGSDGITTPAVEAFHRESSRGLAARGWARVYVLHADGAPRAALYGFRHGRRFSFYQTGHDPEWRARSVGTVLLGHVIEQCFAEGLTEFDFLHGDEPYKLSWANASRRTVRLTASSPGLRPWLREHGRSMDTAARKVAKRFLPEGMQDWLRRKLVE
jgi:CelD/BcsL family acetyltransferase involved in cellulose biosynthesis